MLKPNSIIRLSKSCISEAEKLNTMSVLDHEFLGMGKEVQVFEKSIKAYIDTDHEVVCVNTGTAALHLSILCLDIGIGDEVLVPSLTYVASFQAISATGAKPVSCDINPKTLFLDPEDVKKKITPNTKAIMPVHYASSCVGIEEIYDIAKENNLRIIEDAAHSFGSIYKNRTIGFFGDIICFSFDGIKNITSGEGGAVLSSDKAFINRVKDSRLLGVEKDTEQRFNNQRTWSFDVKYQGFRYHMSNIMAAIGIAQLKRIESFKTIRQKIVNIYIQHLAEIKDVSLLELDYKFIMPHIFVIKVESKLRDALKKYLEKNNIQVGIHWYPNHLHTKYATSLKLKNTEKVFGEILSLPCHCDLTTNEQHFVIQKIKDFFNEK